MTFPDHLPRYNRHQTYQWNYDHAPEPATGHVPMMLGEWDFFGLPTHSPLGIPAGPLLNGRWILYYASLGFDVLTYKTVRSTARQCYPLPNLQPVQCDMLAGGEERLSGVPQEMASWAVSFGMPSMSPDVWRNDVRWTQQQLPPGKVLTVSVVGSVQPGWSMAQLADDYAQCAAWAVEAGADVVEANLSCPNVSTCDGQLYQQPAAARLVAQRLRDAVGDTPLVLKIGHVPEAESASLLLEAVAPAVDGLAMTNSVAVTVLDASTGKLLFDGERRGICGQATRQASLNQVRLFHEICERMGLSLKLIGVGGASTADDVKAYLAAGAHHVQLATAAMLNPAVALQIRRDWKPDTVEPMLLGGKPFQNTKNKPT